MPSSSLLPAAAAADVFGAEQDLAASVMLMPGLFLLAQSNHLVFDCVQLGKTCSLLPDRPDIAFFPFVDL